ncbi:MAG: glycosyltransferase family 4 protein [Deltaproteobacteria bacterium]|nr:glycosyltransferase family 4 protein [Deltaproteobacteria bacterium]
MLIVATRNYPPTVGGIETLCYALVRALHAQGVSVHVVAPEAPGSDRVDAIEPYPITRYSSRRTPGLKLYWAVSKVLQSHDAPVLCGQWTSSSLLVVKRALSNRPTRLLSFGHGKEFLLAGSAWRRSFFFARYMREVLMRTEIVAISRYTASLAREAGAQKVHLLNPGVDTARFTLGCSNPLPAQLVGMKRPRLLTVARLVPRKGIDTVIAALPTIAKRHPNIQYLVAGEGPDLPRLQSMTVERRIQDRVHFLGRVPDPQLPALYGEADLFVLLARQELKKREVEGFGLVLLEAQACGTPVIAARSGGMVDALLEDQTGLAVPENDPSSFAQQAGDLLENSARLSAMCTAARAHAVKNDWSQTATRLRSLLRI